jgi:ATP-dependent Clp protease protease subunit
MKIRNKVLLLIPLFFLIITTVVYTKRTLKILNDLQNKLETLKRINTEIDISNTISLTTQNSLDLTNKINSSLNSKIKISNINNNKNNTILLEGKIDENSANFVINELNTLAKDNKNKELYLLLSSPGGSVLDGAKIISKMESLQKLGIKVHTICLDLCASMAAVIHSYGTKRLAINRSVLMYHPASGMTAGQLENMLSLLNTLKRYVDKFNNNIVSRSKLSKSEFDQKTAFGFWIDAEDALVSGLVDEIVDITYKPEPVFFGLFNTRNSNININEKNKKVEGMEFKF